MNPIRSVTVDLDGTLLDTVPDLAAAANAMMRELGRPEYPLETIASFVGRGIPKLVARCLPDLEEAGVEAAQAIFRHHYAIENGRCSTIFPGVIEGLQAMRDAGLRLAVITNKAAAFTEPLLVATGLAPWFEFAVSGDSLAHKKPHPAQLLNACQRMGTQPGENLHIGDSHHDAVAARAAGCPVFIVPYGYNEGEDVQGIDCDAIVASLAEAYRRIAGTDSRKTA
ncbi:phosphoglycolate phosphatase [Sulfuritalea sp.]|uniref:phosphoglycolate phosphatase n=1 Tax=Sulfuritalea sp. TaxID=2480090 RepID=UPI001AC57F9E|nr:phosphoglycolate phosphatase [Sulfuritalea sp.]MBN8473569.1 phosphoglycolate phosphatase [Sulfuritalea sp.]